MIMNKYQSPKELAEEARRVLKENPMTPDELFELLVEKGIIDRQGRVLVMKLFGGNNDRQAESPESPPPDSAKNEA